MAWNMKPVIAGLFFMWAAGSITGYFLAKWDLQANAIASPVEQPQKANVASKQVDIRAVKPVKSDRQLLVEKYRLCGGAGDISAIADSQLFESVQKICLEKS